MDSCKNLGVGTLRGRALRVVVGLTLASLVLAGCGAAAVKSSSSIPAGPITLGAIYTLSGPFAAFGEVNLKTDQALIARMNAAGGIAGHKIKLTYQNDQGNPADAVAAANQLVADHVAGIIYDGTSATVEQATAVFMKAKIPVVDFDPSDFWNNVKQWPYDFTVYSSFYPQAQTILKFAKYKGVSKIGFLGDTTPFAVALGGDLVSVAKAKHFPYVTQNYSLTTTDVTPQLTTLKNDGVQAIVLDGETGFGYVYNGLQSLNWHPYIFTTFAAYFVDYSSLGSLGRYAYSTCQTNIGRGQSLPPTLNTLVPYVIQKTGIQFIGEDSVLLNENDILDIFKYAIEKAHSLNGTTLRNTIEHISGIGFTVKSYKYYFSPTHRTGWPASESYMCYLTPLGPDQSPITAPGS